MRELRVQLLGPVQAWRGAADLELGSAQRRAVFAILALHANETVSRAELVDGIWGERPPAKAVGILHTYIYDLRRVLDPERDKRTDSTVLTTVQSSYSLRLDPEQLDEHRFATHHEQAQRNWARGDLPSALDALNAGIALWRGEALHGVSGPFAELQRARLEESRITAVEQRGALLLIRGDHAGVLDELAELVAAAPLRETARGLLMVALNQAGRRDEALALYQDTEQMLISEQGIEPGPALRRIHEKITAARPVPSDAISAGIWTPRHGTERTVALPETTGPTPPPLLAGRDDDVTWLRSLLPNLLAGQGNCVGVDGAPGVGKTALVAAAFTEPAQPYAVVWSPLSDGTVALVEQLCAQRPLVFVVDDLHSVDDTGLLVWHRLSRLTQQLPLLLIGVFRTFPQAAALGQLRGAVSAVGGRIKTIEPLTSEDIAGLAERRLDALCGPWLRELLDAAAGNPLSAKELLDTAMGAGVLDIAAGVADLSPDHPVALDDVLSRLARDRLGFLTPATRDMLAWAALLGMRFDLGDLAVVMHTSAADLVAAVDEAIVAGTLDDSDQCLAFRGAVLHRVLLQERAPEARAALHRDAAEALAAAGVPVERIAGQLLAAPVDAWTVRWLLDNIDAVAAKAPTTAVELLEHAVAGTSPADEHHGALAVRRVRLAFHLGRHAEAEARAVLDTTDDAEHAAEMRWILANLDYRSGAVGKVLADLRAAEKNPAVPAFWRARYETLRAQFERGGLDDLDAAERTAEAALHHAISATDPAATAAASGELWYVDTVRRDHRAALAQADTALEMVGHTTGLVQWQLDLLDNRAFSLQSLDRLDEASQTLARMRSIGTRLHPPAGRPHVVSAVHDYWVGHWDEALTQLALVAPDGAGARFHDLRSHAPLLQHGVAALIAAHRGDTDQLQAHLRAAEAYPLITTGDQENSDFLLVARAIEAGIRVGVTAELAAMDPILDLKYGRTTLRHQWLPRIMRLALDAGDQNRATAAVRVCEIEAAREAEPARAHAALRWCRALADRDPDVLLAVAAHYGEVGRSVEMAAALVDAAIALAKHRKIAQARLTFSDAAAVLTELGAASDLDRATARLSGLGIDDVGMPADQPMLAGWRSLSDLERRIAELVAEAKPNPEIAAELALSRRDVQSHLSLIMQKLGVESRADLAIKIGQAATRSTSRSGRQHWEEHRGDHTGRPASGRGPRPDPGVAR